LVYHTNSILNRVTDDTLIRTVYLQSMSPKRQRRDMSHSGANGEMPSKKPKLQRESSKRTKVQDDTAAPPSVGPAQSQFQGSEKENSNTSTPPDVHYFLMKSEPESRVENGVQMKFSIHDLEQLPNQATQWDGVRNAAARNTMRNMKVGDFAFFYHSNCKIPGIAGIVTITRTSYPDRTQFDPEDPHYDSKSNESKPKWDAVDVKFVRCLRRFIPLEELKRSSELSAMPLMKQTRLSVQQITADHWEFILKLEEQDKC